MLDRARSRRWPDDILVGVAVLATMTAAAAYMIAHGRVLGWDESIYAAKARSIVTSLGDQAWQQYRPPGLPVLGTLAGAANFSDAAVRSVSGALGIVALAAMWILGRLTIGRWGAIVGLLIACASPVVLDELRQFHNDLPSAGVLLLLMALLWYSLETRETPDWRMLLAAPLAAGAFYLRYGAVVMLVAIAATTVLLWGPHLWRHRVISVATALLTALLALPHLVIATLDTGSPLGIVSASASKVDTTGPLTAVADYVAFLPDSFAGPLGIIAIATGALMLCAVATLRVCGHATPQRTKGIAWLGIPAVASTIGTVLVSHAEARYLIPPFLLACLIAGAAMTTIGASVLPMASPGGGAKLVRVISAGSLVALALVSAYLIRRDVFSVGRRPDPNAWIAESGAWIRNHVAPSCDIATTISPMIGWYAGCRADSMLPSGAYFSSDDPHRPGIRRVVVLTTQDSGRVDAETIQRYRSLTRGEPTIRIDGLAGGAEIFVLDP